LLLEPVNLLILDEPTNHLDMQSKDVLKQAIKDFDGTAIIVSHDRDFLDGLVSKVYEFGGGRVREHLGGIYDFLQKKQIDSLNELGRTLNSTGSPSSNTQPAQNAHSAQTAHPAPPTSYQEQKEHNKLVKRKEKAVAEAEANITRIEEAIRQIETQLATPEGAANTELFTKYSELKKQLSTAEDEWTTLSIELDELR
ncbi:MAG: ABC-F family ATP-binding cassette domain-containing protein, partial [Bacteroidaceae bacterium]|nr:ABC-F family ATP-binding cassette domain-containing protein [Bacteroidaceae bacterium]